MKDQERNINMSEKMLEDGSDEKEENNTSSEIVSEETDKQGSDSLKEQDLKDPSQENLQENQLSSKMLLGDSYISPDRRPYHIIAGSPPGVKSKAETFVTRSLVDKYGPIVSPAISPTRPLENKETLLKSRSPLLDKTDRDYEAATLICSIGEAVNNMQRNMHELTSSSIDTLRVSRISTLLGFAPAAVQDYSNSPRNRVKPSNFAIRDNRRGSNHYEGAQPNEDSKSSNREYCNGHSDSVKKENSFATPNSSTPDDTDDSECENDDYSMIIRPRDPENTENGDSSAYTCRLPCCTRLGYSAQFSSDHHPPIRVPARRPAHFSNESSHQQSEAEQEVPFSRYRDSAKSAFSTVSPTRKRAEPEFSYSTMPAIKVRVIKETKPPLENRYNGDVKPVVDSENASTVIHHFRDSVYTTIKTEKDIEPQYQYANPNDETKHIKTSKERSYPSMTLVNGVGVLSSKHAIESSEYRQSFQKETNLLLARVPSTHRNGLTTNYASTLSSQHVAQSGYSFIKRESSPSGSRPPVVQCSTVDSTATPDNADGESRLLDLARIANEQLGEELARQQPIKKGKPKSNDCLHLWEFLRDILNNDTMAPRAIEWTVKERGEFRLIKTSVVAQLWGLSKNRTSMTYEKMARAMRYYYKMKILEKVPHKRLHFRFGKHMLPKVLVSKE